MAQPKLTRRKITDYQPNPRNHNQGSERGSGMIEQSFRDYGAGRSLLADKNGVLIAGIEDVIEIETDGKTLVVVKRKDLDLTTDHKAIELGYMDNRANEVSYTLDPVQLDEDIANGVDFSSMYTAAELDALIGSVNIDTDNLLGLSDDMPLDSHDVPDALWPTDNEWGIPVLDLALQADAVDLPVNAYGEHGRKTKMNGTYHMYTDDYRFEGLWKDPTPVINSGCVNVVEPNYSTNVQMPPALVLFHTYRKRWLARYWQAHGVRIFVDLDVNAAFDYINLLGVPKGWKSYACYMRKSDHKPEELLRFLEVAKTHAETDSILLLVIGGEKDVQALCKVHPQCVWAASFEQKFYRNYRQKTVGQ